MSDTPHIGSVTYTEVIFAANYPFSSEPQSLQTALHRALDWLDSMDAELAAGEGVEHIDVGCTEYGSWYVALTLDSTLWPVSRWRRELTDA